MQSYLKDMALEWFKPDLLQMADPTLHPLFVVKLLLHHLICAQRLGSTLSINKYHFYNSLTIVFPTTSKRRSFISGSSPLSLSSATSDRLSIHMYYWEHKSKMSC